MSNNLWTECLNCGDKCCKWRDSSFPLFLTSKEKESFPDINLRYPCLYFNKDSLCDIHADRPIDCRLYPFDILKINDIFFWICFETSCLISRKDRNELEFYLKEHENKLIPEFKDYMEDYSKFKFDELIKKYKFVVLRKVIFRI
ncbi:YkgJ family cysteine cluster protein [Patescibacteria group bacterium]